MPGSSPGMTGAFDGVRSRSGCTLFSDSIFKQPHRLIRTCLHDRAARSARVLQKSSAPFEGVGNAGCPLHPRPRVHFVLVERTRVTTSTPESPGIPARNGFNGLCRALPGDRALLPPSPRGLRFCHCPVGPIKPPQDLTPASGRQDHTILPYATTSLVRVLSIAHRPKPALRSYRAQNAAASTASRAQRP
jgi:hypothetical protein